MNYLTKIIADNQNKDSLANEFRFRRHVLFLGLIKKISKPIRILDIGGTEEYWNSMNFEAGSGIEINLLNLEKINTYKKGFTSIKGDATNLSEFGDKYFDVIFSNSCIEHLFTFENQEKMAKEVRRVGRYYFIQTPNYWFPIEPHYVFPFFQFLPFHLQLFLQRNFSLGHIGKIKERDLAIDQIEEIKLLSLKQMKKLFPDGQIWSE